MSTHLSTFFQARRIELGFRLSEVARKAGRCNLSKACNKLHRFEQTGTIRDELLTQVSAVLDIDDATVRKLIKEDRREFLEAWAKWAAEPIRSYIIVHIMPSIYCPQPLPDEILTSEEAEEYASLAAKTWKKRLVLILSRKVSLVYDRNGSVKNVREAVPGEPNTPFTLVKGSRPLLPNILNLGSVIQEVN